MIGIINFGSRKTGKIAERLLSVGFACRIIDWEQTGNIDWKEFSGLILSGAPVLLTETDTKIFTGRFEFLKIIDIPVLGICFGHQLLGLLFGAQVYKGEAVRTETEISILSENVLFEGLHEKIKMVEDHTEGITLPASFITLASSEKYEIEAMRHSALNIFGVQFHPEVSGENGLKLLNNFCKLTKSI